MKKKRIILYLALAVALVAYFLRPADNLYDLLKNDISFFQEENAAAISVNNKPKRTAEGILHKDTQQSPSVNIDGTQAAFMTALDGQQNRILWYTNDTDLIRVAEKVEAYQLAASGGAVAYTVTDGNSRLLYGYNTKSKKIMWTAENIMSDGFCLSPDGKIGGYGVPSDDNGAFTGYLIKSGKPAEVLGENKMPIAITNGGKTVYFVQITAEGNKILYVKKNNVEIQLTTDTEHLFFNKDLTQLIYQEGNASYLYHDGESVKIAEEAIQGLASPRYLKSFSYYHSGTKVVIYGVSRFSALYFQTETGLITLDKKYEATRLSDALSGSAQISADGKKLFYINSSEQLCYVPVQSTETVVAAENVQWYGISDNARHIYYLDTQMTLWYRKDESKPTALANNVKPGLAMSGRECFYISNDELYQAIDGEKNVIQSAGAVHAVWDTSANVFCLMEAEHSLEVYRGVSGIYLYFGDYVQP